MIKHSTMNRSIETPVLIVGAGPVGLTLAIDLSSRGIDVTIIEIRRAGILLFFPIIILARFVQSEVERRLS